MHRIIIGSNDASIDIAQYGHLKVSVNAVIMAKHWANRASRSPLLCFHWSKFLCKLIGGDSSKIIGQTWAIHFSFT